MPTCTTTRSAALAACALASIAADRVRPRFAWPAGPAWVEVAASRHTEVDGRVVSDSVATGLFAVTIGGDDPMLVTLDGAVMGEDDAAGRADPPARALIGAWPSYRIDRGRFLGLANPADVDAEAALWVAHSTIPAESRENAAHLLGAESLARSAGLEWDALVGAWTGHKWRFGAIESEVAPVYVADLGAEIPMLITFQAVGAEACDPTDTELGCVRFRMKRILDLSGEAAAEAAVAADLGPGEWDVEIAETIEVVAMPATMVPHQFTHELRVGIRGGGTPARSAENVDRSVRIYHFGEAL